MNAVAVFLLLVLAANVSNLAASEEKGLKPEFRVPAYKKTLDSGMKQLLICRAVGGRPTEYKWYNNKYGDEITGGRGELVYTYVGKTLTFSLLIFETLGTEHEGSYTCTASNDNGQAYQGHFLQVYDTSGMKPELTAPHRNVTLESGGVHALSCRARGEQPITYNWYNKDGDEIARGSVEGKEPVYVTNSRVRSSLIFERLGREHEGSYTCTASNAIGETSEEVFLRVVPPGEMADIDKDNENPVRKK